MYILKKPYWLKFHSHIYSHEFCKSFLKPLQILILITRLMFPSLRMQVRLKAAPALVLILLALLRLSGLLDSSAPLAAYSYGALSGWVYLRFYQKHSRGRGDMSDHFAFASFFPEALQPAVGLLAGLVHSALVKMKVCRKMVKRYDVGAPSSITISLPGTDPQDAERRRWAGILKLKPGNEYKGFCRDTWNSVWERSDYSAFLSKQMSLNHH